MSNSVMIKRWVIGCGTAMIFLLAARWASGVQEGVPESPLSLSGFSPSQAYEVDDVERVQPTDEFLIGLLFRVGKVSRESLERFEAYSDNVPLSRVREDPRKFRFWVRDVSGEVTSVEEHLLNFSDSGLKSYFEVGLSTGDGSAKVLTRKIPDSWVDGDASGQSISARGFFLKFEQTGQNTVASQLPTAVYVANRLAWYPRAPNGELKISDSQVLLAGSGFDVGLLDLVRLQDKRHLGNSDSVAFYEMLSAVSSIERDEMPESPNGFVDLIQHSVRHFGDSVAIQGRVRRCVPIEIESAFVRRMTGLDRYFELDMFYLLDGGQRIVLSSKGGEPLEYRHRFPMTVCVAELPSGCRPEEIEDRVVQIDGFFFRFWNYEAEFTGKQRGQLSPLIVGLPPVLLDQYSGLLDSVLMYGLVAFLLGTGVLIWIFYRSDRGFQPRSRRGALPEQVDLRGVDGK